MELPKARKYLIGSYGTIIILCLLNIIVGYAKYNLPDYYTPKVKNTTTTQRPFYYWDDESMDANYNNHVHSPHFFLVFPSFISLFISLAFIIIEISTKSIFESSMGVMTSFILWLMHLIFLLIYYDDNPGYGNNKEHKNIFYMAVPGMGILHGIDIIIYMMQMAGLGWYLKKLDVGWPNCKLGHLFTFETLFVIPRFVLAMIPSITYFSGHTLILGINNYCYECPNFRSSEAHSYTVGIIYVINFIFSTEALISTYFGIIHRKCCSIITGVISIGMIVAMIFSSRSIIYSLYGANSYYSDGTSLGSASIVLSTLHAILNFVAPAKISTTPKCIKILSKKQSPKVPKLVNGYGRLLAQTGGANEPEHMTSAALKINFVVFCVVVINLILASIENQFPGHWSEIILLTMNVAVFIRCFSFLLTYKITGQTIPQPAASLVISFLLESIPMFIGAIGTLIVLGYTYHYIMIAPAILSILIVLFQGIILTRNTTALGGVYYREDTTSVLSDQDSAATIEISEAPIANNSNHIAAL